MFAKQVKIEYWDLYILLLEFIITGNNVVVIGLFLSVFCQFSGGFGPIAIAISD